jgi:hypothetical protein
VSDEEQKAYGTYIDLYLENIPLRTDKIEARDAHKLFLKLVEQRQLLLQGDKLEDNLKKLLPALARLVAADKGDVKKKLMNPETREQQLPAVLRALREEYQSLEVWK